MAGDGGCRVSRCARRARRPRRRRRHPTRRRPPRRAAAAVAALPRPVDSDLIYRLGAVCRAAQMAGALETALALATQYANDRVQFGRPIGKFQAIQQQLALLAEQVAAATVAVTNAADAIVAGDDSFFAAAIAKIRAGEAAGRG